MLFRYGLALVLVAAYLLWCWCLYKRHRAHTAKPDVDGADWLVAYASQSGQAAAYAKQTAQQLEQSGYSAVLLSLNQVQAATLKQKKRLLIIASSYGEGEAPDNGRFFLSRLPKRLLQLEFAVLALGDSSYDCFCGFAKQIEQALLATGARQLFQRIDVDNKDAKALAQWQKALQLKQGFTAEVMRPWRLIGKTCINPDSQGEPVYHLRFSSTESHHWQAGDIAEIQIGDTEEGVIREYSVASLPDSRQLELLVRQHPFGVGSNWLCQQVDVGKKVQLRLRSNTTFHLPPSAKPVLFIANGTGIAGIKAHILQRIKDGFHNNWLIFGERQANIDEFFQQDIQQWQASGELAFCDYAFSREQPKRYVQDVLRLQQARLIEYLSQGASLVICGSKEGMAEGVETVLLDLISQKGLQELIEQGRYIRDVY